jgi:hypothetical protein
MENRIKMIKLNYEEMMALELLETIKDCQKELERRGTITECFNVFWKPNSNIKTILITNKNKQIKNILKEIRK